MFRDGRWSSLCLGLLSVRRGLVSFLFYDRGFIQGEAEGEGLESLQQYHHCILFECSG